jgi:hypothetical protein
MTGETIMTTDEQITLQGVGRQLNSIIERINAIDTQIAIIASMITRLDESFTDMSDRIFPPMPPLRNRRHRVLRLDDDGPDGDAMERLHDGGCGRGS